MAAAGALLISPAFLRSALAAPKATLAPYGALRRPNKAGIMLPRGFTGRQIARGGQIVPGTSYPWHFASDGAATFRTLDGGYVLVSNSEAPSGAGGGASAIRFNSSGQITDAYRILAGTNINCAGGPTRWGTWLSCEEHEGGLVWESDPAGVLPAVARPALGNFSHEAAAVDPVAKHVYLTEDQPDSCFYRFTPDSYPSLASGLLEVAVVAPDRSVTWRTVPDPNLVSQGTPTRSQVPGATKFNGGEGLWYHQGFVYFTTKNDKKVWAYNARTRKLDTVYDRATTPGSALDAVDNVTVSPRGDIFVCEDGGNMEICVITANRASVAPFCRLGQYDGSPSPDHQGSEMAGVVFDPSGTRMYFSSQRAYPHVVGTPAADGAIYEVTGPFRMPESGVVPPAWVYGPPEGERLGGPLHDSAAGIQVEALSSQIVATADGAKLPVSVTMPRAGTVDVVLRTNELETEPRGNATHDRPVPVHLAATQVKLGAGTHRVDLPLERSAVARLRREKPAGILTGVAVSSGGTRAVAAQRIPLT